MEKDVLIKVSGVQFSEETKDPEPIEVITAGSYYSKNGKHYLRYEEIMPDEAGTTKNTVKISPDSVDILKKGTANTHMLFQKDQKTLSYYYTPFGNLEIGLNTRSIDIVEETDFLSVEVQYGLELNQQHVADCHIMIRADEKNSGRFQL